MASVSPTPLGLRHDGLPRRALPRRPELRRGSPLAIVSTFNDQKMASNQDSLAESSDDEGSVPVLSAEAQEILAVKISNSQNEPGPLSGAALYSAAKDSLRRSTPISQLHGLERRTSSPSLARSGSPRIVRLSTKYEKSGGLTTLRRAVSTFRLKDGPHLINTPVQQNKSSADAQHPGSGMEVYDPQLQNNAIRSAGSEIQATHNMGDSALIDLTQDSPVPTGSQTTGKTKGEKSGVYGSLKVRRVGTVTGKFLSEPAKRGMLRRHSDETTTDCSYCSGQ